MDLSAPAGSSINDGIEKSRCSLDYTSVDQAAALVNTNCQLAKIKSAYRIIPVHPEDALLLGMRWQEGCTLIQPSHLACAVPQRYVCNAVADGLTWILQSGGVRFVLHYLDDFLVAGPPASEECDQALRVTLKICEELGVRLQRRRCRARQPASPSWASRSIQRSGNYGCQAKSCK